MKLLYSIMSDSCLFKSTLLFLNIEGLFILIIIIFCNSSIFIENSLCCNHCYMIHYFVCSLIPEYLALKPFHVQLRFQGELMYIGD